MCWTIWHSMKTHLESRKLEIGIYNEEQQMLIYRQGACITKEEEQKGSKRQSGVFNQEPQTDLWI